MMGLYLVEEHLLAGLRVPDDCRRSLHGPQPVLTQPLPFHPGFPALRLHLSSVLGAEEILPLHIQPARIVAHVEDTSPREFLAQLGSQPSQRQAPVRQWRRPSLVRRARAMEHNAARPAVHLRTLVMEEDRTI